MEYRAVGNRVAVIFESLRLPISQEEAMAVLLGSGFVAVSVDMIALARQCIGTSKYQRGAKPSEAPFIVDCSSFIKWIYGVRGIWLPRRSIQQRELGKTVGLNEVVAGDVVFVSGWIDYYHDDPADGVGHVGIVTGEGTVIHAEGKKNNVVETSLDAFASHRGFRGVRRYIPIGADVITLEAPVDREVELADDVRWIVLQSLPRS